MRTLALTLALVASLAVPAPAPQTKTEAALLAELRQTQELVARQATQIGQLTDRLAALEQRLADQDGVTTRTVADQRARLTELTNAIAAMREDQKIRATQTAQDLAALRETVRQLSEKGGKGQAPPSPDALMNPALGDLTANRPELAIAGFKDVITSFPGTAAAAKAQFYIGEAYSQMSRPQEAIAAYDKTIADYKDAEFAREAMFMKGVTLLDKLRNPVQARATFEALIKQFPGSTQAARAQERLKTIKGATS